jgi:sugar lactone lactonase YvrE
MRRILITLLFLSTASFAQENPVKDFPYYWRQAQNTYQAKDYPAYFENMKEVIKFRPDNPTMKYNLAGAQALVGNKSEALALLNTLAEMGLVYDAAADEDFSSIRDSEEFKSLLKKFAQNKMLIDHSEVAFKLSEKDLITEGVAYDPKTATFYVGSVHKRKIVRIDKKGASKDFATAESGLWSVMGMKVDAPRRTLWVCSAAVPEMQGFQKDDEGRSGVFSFDLKTGRRLQQLILPNQPQPHVLGDLTISSSGEIYLSDSRSPAIYKIAPEKNELELFLASDLLRSPQGLALSADEKTLFVADYSVGIIKVDLAAKHAIKIAAPENVAFTTIDGMYFYKNSLIAIQNGINPHRVMRFFLNQNDDRIERTSVIAANHPLFNEPTLGVLVRDTFYYIANSQWGSFNKDKTIFFIGKTAGADCAEDEARVR